MKIRLASAALVAALALGIAACGEEAVSKDEVESEVSSLIAQQTGEKPKSVDCPEDLKAEKGEKMRCDLTAGGGQKLGAEVTVTSVDGDKANFSVEVVE
jgi:NAD(P)H-hydrate repair Nnr-like enzyme with NAD(P)H-hydrate epimerase domain